MLALSGAGVTKPAPVVMDADERFGQGLSLSEAAELARAGPSDEAFFHRMGRFQRLTEGGSIQVTGPMLGAYATARGLQEFREAMPSAIRDQATIAQMVNGETLQAANDLLASPDAGAKMDMKPTHH